MKNYQENVTATLHEDQTGTYLIWLDEENELHITDKGEDEVIARGTKEWKILMKKYAPALIKVLN